MAGRCVHGAAMSFTMDEAGVGRVADFFARIGTHLTFPGQRESFATYAFVSDSATA